MQFDPALPWSYGDGGTITLNEEVTQEQLLLGRVHLVVDYDDEIVDATFALSGSQLVVKAENTTVYNVSLDETGHILTLTAVVDNVMPISAEIVLAPVAGSLKAHKVEGLLDDYCLTCQMTDGTQRALTHDGALIVGYQNSPDMAEFAYEPTPLVETSQTKPSPVSFHFIDTIATVPSTLELETIEVDYDYTDYGYIQEEDKIYFEVQLIADSVVVNKTSTLVAEDNSPVLVEIDSPDLTFTPSLPWDDSTRGTITLNNDTVTEEELILGRIRFNVEKNGEAVETSVKRDYIENSLYLSDGNDILYFLHLSQDGNVITVDSPELESVSINGAKIVLEPARETLMAYYMGGSNFCLVCRMTDNSFRALTQNGRLIVGSRGQNENYAKFNFSPSPLTSNSPEKPNPIPFEFVDTIQIPAGFELGTLEVSYDYEYYVYDQEEDFAAFELAIKPDSFDNVAFVGYMTAGSNSPNSIEIADFITISPKLPWATGFGGSVTINTGITLTEDDLIANKLMFNCSYNWNDVSTEVERRNDGIFVKNDDDVLMYKLQLSQDGRTVTVESLTSDFEIYRIRYFS